MISKLTKQSAAEADFTREDAERCGWHFPEDGVRALTLEEVGRELEPKSLERIERDLRRGGSPPRAEKYTPGTGMTRLSGRTEDDLLEQVFQHERREYEAASQRDVTAFDYFTDATNDLIDGYNEHLRALKRWSAVPRKDAAGKAEAHKELRAKARRFQTLDEAAILAGQRVADALEADGKDVDEFRELLERCTENHKALVYGNGNMRSA